MEITQNDVLFYDNGSLGILFLFAIRPTIPYSGYFLRQLYMLIRLYPISLDTYSTS